MTVKEYRDLEYHTARCGELHFTCIGCQKVFSLAQGYPDDRCHACQALYEKALKDIDSFKEGCWGVAK